MPDDLYTADILRWSGQQADLLRRLAGGERVNDAIDWENVIEEVESVGRSELTAVKSLLIRVLEHLLKIHAWPEGPQEHWRGEAIAFLGDAADRWAPAMRQQVDLQALFKRALSNVVRTTFRGRPAHPLPTECPFDIDDVIVSLPVVADMDILLARLAAPAG